jgi:hypothetical protein
MVDIIGFVVLYDLARGALPLNLNNRSHILFSPKIVNTRIEQYISTCYQKNHTDSVLWRQR